ncbi:MAG TPA: glycogen-binding domain-containing protein [Gemmatimonadales bacterium]|nr:glycogen-binding domain-containing protein [Gemmatimonadales bacterium]
MARPGWWVVFLFAPGTLAAQVAALTTGGGIGQFDQSATGAIGTIAFDARGQLGPILLDAASSTISYQDLGTRNQAIVDARWAFARDGWRAGIGPRFETGNAIRTGWSEAWSGTGGVRRTLGPFELAVELGEGIAHPHDQQISFGRRGVSAGVSTGALTVRGNLDVTVMRDSTLRDDVFYDGSPRTDPETLFRDRVRSISDLAIMVTITLPSLEFSGTVGRRSGDDIATQAWWRVRALVPLTEVASIEVGANRNPADIVLGLPGGRETTLGLRVALPDRTRQTRAVARAVVERQDARHVRIILTLPGASRVRLMGEFTGWRPVDLEPLGGGKYAASFFATGGTYRLNVALDDGPWVAPPGMPRVDDGFGGLVGLLEL